MFGIGRSDWIHRAVKGESRWSGNPLQSLRTVFGMFDESVHILANADLKSVADLKGEKVNIGKSNTLFRAAAEATLNAYDLSVNDIQPSTVNPLDAFNLVRKGEIDATIYTVGSPSQITHQTLKTQGLHLLAIGDTEARRMIKEHPFL